jgi:hypothetical protein
MNWIILLAAIIISVLIFTWFVGTLKDTIRMAIAVAAILLILLWLFGIHPREIWQQFRAIWLWLIG